MLHTVGINERKLREYDVAPSLLTIVSHKLQQSELGQRHHVFYDVVILINQTVEYLLTKKVLKNK